MADSTDEVPRPQPEEGKATDETKEAKQESQKRQDPVAIDEMPSATFKIPRI